MCDGVPDMKSSLLLSESLIALAPGTVWRDTGIVLASVSLTVFLARHQCPLRKLNMLKASIGVVEETLQYAKAMPTHASSHDEIIDAESQFLQVKLSASKIQTRMLEMRDEGWKAFFKSLGALVLALRHCAARVKEIQTTLLLAIEEGHQRKLKEGIKESRKALSTVARSPTRRAYRATHRSASSTNSFQDSYSSA